ncbi:hypothetical protein A3A21_00185 [Candidatus Jorgensenbacteria bacterium RIFCSPLOWO2_01_FULL_45_25b]|uniref:Pseudouridine synthase n=1 Tax=Candidatus Jorgensenbacteria bacterium RIFCSPLOWO2_01_FULL_45_25b TaxID=1798471 RepID=A0A1F6BRY8_9BACT|nr:MAG: hypothetical protein A3A21_00185 [Candidatus Jorgensenbacteria bacterium RIFCSPLOWO2_01_FULL_45_25b]
MRIQKYLSEQGVMSRREAEESMRKGFVTCNGKVVRDLGRQIDPERDRIRVLSSSSSAERKMTILVNKPRGVVSSKNPKEGFTVFQMLPQFANLHVVGRLDKESEGALLLSNDGPVTASVTSEKHLIEKEYEVWIREVVRPGRIRKMEEGVLLEDGRTLPARVSRIDDHAFRIVLREGRKHQIRRMAAVLMLTVTRLKRIRIGDLTLKGLKEGGFRALSFAEVQAFKRRS